MLGLKVGLGLAIICVTVTKVPLFAVEVESVVKADGVLVVSAPLLSVTVTKSGVESVELNEVIMIILSDNEGEKRTYVGVRIMVESSDEGGRGIVEGEEKIGIEVSGGVDEDEDEKDEKDENEMEEDEDDLEKDDEDETVDGGGLTDGLKPEVKEEEKVLEEDDEDEDEDMMEEKKEKEEEEEGRVVVVVVVAAVVVLLNESD